MGCLTSDTQDQATQPQPPTHPNRLETRAEGSRISRGALVWAAATVPAPGPAGLCAGLQSESAAQPEMGSEGLKDAPQKGRHRTKGNSCQNGNQEV